MKNSIVIIIIAALIAGAGGFFAGMKYQQSKTANFRSQMRGQFNQGQRLEGMTGFRPVSGKIISRDDSSITVEMSDGSSKIVLISESSTVNKTQETTIEDLVEGENVVIFGQENSDGSVTASNIQIGAGFGERFNPPPGLNSSQGEESELTEPSGL